MVTKKSRPRVSDYEHIIAEKGTSRKEYGPPYHRKYRVKVALVMPITVQADSREQAVRMAKKKAMDSRMDWDDRYYWATDEEIEGRVGFHILRVD